MNEIYDCTNPGSQQPGNFYQYMLFIRPRYAMFTGAERLRDIQTFIGGFIEAARVLGAGDKSAIVFDENFHDFMCSQYNRPTSAESWSTIITRKMKRNHQLAIEEFYRLFDLFFSQQQMK